MEDTKYQVFISSTYDDLKKARAKIIETILKLYHLPVGMEMFSADDDEQWDVIKETINFSDYYIVIIGHRYGSETDTGISYTEKEYDYAKNKKIPILSYIQNRTVATQPSERDTDTSKIEKLNTFIEKAKKSKMCEFWDNDDDLATKIAIALPKYFRKNPRTGWIRADKRMSYEISEELASLSTENRKLRELVDDGSIFPVSEEKDFEYIFNKLNRHEQVVLSNANKTQRKNGKPFTDHKFSVNVLSLFVLEINKAKIDFYTNNFDTEIETTAKNLLKKNEIPEFNQYEYLIKSIDIKKELLTFGLIKQYKKDRPRDNKMFTTIFRNQTAYKFSEKSHRFNYWLSVNNNEIKNLEIEFMNDN